VPEWPTGPVSKDYRPIFPFHDKRKKTQEKPGFSHFSALCRNVPKRLETRLSGSIYYRTDEGEILLIEDNDA
jgi:hypothetical protein